MLVLFLGLARIVATVEVDESKAADLQPCNFNLVVNHIYNRDTEFYLPCLLAIKKYAPPRKLCRS